MSWWPWRRRRPSARPVVWTASGRSSAVRDATPPAPAPPATPGPGRDAPPADDAPDAATDARACGWAVTLTDAAGTRSVHGPQDACCSWALTVTDLDPVPAASTHDDDALWWDGEATRVTSGRATTPLYRVAEHRRTELGPDRVTALLERSRRPDEVVVTTDPGDADPTVAAGAHGRAAAVWAHHLDVLHDRGAHPAPTDGAAASVVEVGRRVVVRLRATATCDGVADHLDVLASCEASLTTTREASGPVPTAPCLAAWVEVEGKLASADTPTGPVVTSPEMAWARRTDGDTGGVAVHSVPVGDHAVRWRGTLDVSVPSGEVAVVVGHALHLELAGGHATDGRARAEAVTSTRLRVGLGAADEDACPCGTADLVVEVGDGSVVLRVAGQEVPITPA